MKEEGELGSETEEVHNSRTNNNGVKEEDVVLPGPSQAKEPEDDDEMNGKSVKDDDELEDKDDKVSDANDEHQSADNASERESEESVEITHLDCSLLYKEACYAELCSFFNMFSSLLSMKPVTFPKLEEMLCTLYNDEVSPELVELHVTLMRKIYLKFARADKFESALVKFCNSCPSLESEAVQLQRRSYSDLSLSARLIILRALCESQFDCNVKFKENLFNTFQANELRLAPIGSDKNGLCYYYQQDFDLNIRVYTEEPDDSSGATWTLKAKSVEELLLLIGELKSPEFGKKVEGKCEENDEEVDEDEILNKSDNVDDKDVKNFKKEVNEAKPLPEVHLSEAEMGKVATVNKRCSFFDIFKDASVMNKKKNEKEERKKNKERSKNPVPQPKDEEDENVSEEDENEKEVDEETLMAIANEDDRRVLPRRNAKNNAISNIKAFTSKNKTPKKPEKASEKSKAVKHDFVATCEESSEEESDGLFDEEEEEEEPEDASDYEFTLHGEKPFELPAKTTKVVKKKKRGKKTGKKKSKVRLSSVGIAPHKRPNAPIINFESSDEDGVEEEEEKLKERKKATEKTLCMQCRGAKRPDLLLLCDMCDDAWHTFCLKPSLWYVPDGDWFCPNCLHVMLIEKLSFALVKLREALKLKECEDKKKRAAADRLKREMEYIGVSLHNVIPNANVKYADQLSESEESDEDDGQRKSKKRALKRVMAKSRHEKQQFYSPIVTIAEGRSRRALNKVDYNFHAYDEQLQEAMEIETPYKDEPPSGLGRGKDMANIIEAERKRKASEDHGTDNNGDKAVKRLSDSNQPPAKKKARKKSQKRLTDLDVDNLTESSDTDEYRGSNASEHSEEPEPSEDEYLPREFKKTRSARRGGRTRSDDDFIDDDESSDYELPSKRRGNKQKARKGKSNRRGRRRRFSDSDEESEEDSGGSSNFCSDSSDDNKKKRRRGGGRAGVVVRPPSKWGPKQTSSSEEEQSDEEELEIPSASSGEEKTGTGRPLRRAAAQVTKKLKDIEKTLDDYDDEEENEEGEDEDNVEGEGEVAEDTEAKGGADRSDVRPKRPVGTLSQSKRVIKSDDDDSDEFEPEEELEEEDEEDEEEEEQGTEMTKGNEKGNDEDSEKEKRISPNANEEKVETNGAHALSQPKPIDSTKKAMASADVVDETIVKSSPPAAPQKEQKRAAPSPAIVKADPPKAVSQPKSSKTAARRPAVRSRGFSSSSEIQKQASSSSLIEHQNSPSTPSAMPPTITTSQQRALPKTPSSMQQSQAATSSHDTLHGFPPPTAAPQMTTHHSQQQQHFPPYSFNAPYSQHQQEGKFLPPTSTYLPTSQPNAQLHQHHPIAAANYMQQFVSASSSQYQQPQFVYQTLQPYGVLPQQMVIDPRTGQPIEPESLGHALAGAMNPEDL